MTEFYAALLFVISIEPLRSLNPARISRQNP